MAQTIGSLAKALLEYAEKSPLGLKTEVIVTIPPDEGEGVYDTKIVGLRGDEETHALELTIE